MHLSNAIENLKKFIRNNKGFILIILLSLSIRVIFFCQVSPWKKDVLENTILRSDAAGYHFRAVSIADTGTFSSFAVFRTPGYPLFIAFFYYLFGAKVWVVLLAQVLLDVGTGILVFLLAKTLFKSKFISIFAAFLYSINLLSAYYTTRLLTEILFTFVFILSILIFVYAWEKHEMAYLVLVGLLMGVATLIRPILQFFILIPVIVLLLEGRKVFYKFRDAAVLLLVFAAVLSPWQFRNLIRFGTYTLSRAFECGLGCFSVPMVKAKMENKSIEEARKEIMETSGAKRTVMGTNVEGVTDPVGESRKWGKIAKEYILSHPVEYTYQHLKSMIYFFIDRNAHIREVFRLKEIKRESVPLSGSTGITGKLHRFIRESRDEYYISPILWLLSLLEYVFSIIALIVMWFRKQKRFYVVLFILTMIYFPAVVGVMCYDRYRVPVVPLYLVLAAFGVVEFFNLVKSRFG